MNRIALLFLGATILTATAQSQLAYDFDTDNEGWRRADFNPTTFQLTILGVATWNGGGFIDADDFSNWAFHLSPTLSGDFSGNTSIEFDYLAAASAGPAPFLVMREDDEAIFQTLDVTTGSVWDHYSFNFTPGTWFYNNGGTPTLASGTQITHVLSGLTMFGISADMNDGPDYTAVDNIQMVPEPASMLALGLGVVVLAKKRKRR